jgi:hypothetical protein
MAVQPSLRGCAIALVLLGALACSEPRDPIVVSEGILTVENQTGRDWKNVRIVVNHHYNGGAPFLAAGGRITAPLSGFQTGLGYRYDRARMSVFKVEVTATDAEGEPVTLNWGRREE